LKICKISNFFLFHFFMLVTNKLLVYLKIYNIIEEQKFGINL